MGKGWDGHRITPPVENDALTVRDSYPQQANTAGLNPAQENNTHFFFTKG